MTYFNRTIKSTASLLGVLLGLSSIVNHGLFEVLQGNVATKGFFIDAIGEAQRFWLYGTEGAFTLIPNFLITGISVILVGLLSVVWSLKFLHLKHGSRIFLIAFVLLILIGGGLGFVILILPTWAFSTRINRPLKWWEKVLPVRLRKVFSRIWIYSLLLTSLCWIIVMELGIFGYFPGQGDPDVIMNIVFMFLFFTVFFACLTFICAISKDIDEHFKSEEL